jgi:serpin B
MPQRNTSAALVNALYFKAMWDTPFSKGLTKDQDFWLESCQTAKVPGMILNKSLPYFENEAWQAVSLSYTQGTYSYVIVLPRARRNTSSIVESLTPHLLASILDSFKRTQVNLSVPKHKVKQGRNLVDSMQSLGVTVPFSHQADFSAMTSLPVSISAIIHEAVIAVDEAGTEAAAATAIVMAKSAFLIEDEPKEMKVDRPFAFALFHNESRAPLFIGVVGDPRQAS